MVRYLFYTIGDLTYQSPLVFDVVHISTCYSTVVLVITTLYFTCISYVSIHLNMKL